MKFVVIYYVFGYYLSCNLYMNMENNFCEDFLIFLFIVKEEVLVKFVNNEFYYIKKILWLISY